MGRMRAGLDGNKWRASHQATIDAILGPLGVERKVSSRGNQFYNMDLWTGRQFLAAMCQWAELNPGARPDETTVRDWVLVANQTPYDRYGNSVLVDRGIVIGQTPDDLPPWLAMALMGGGYHEAWHTEYSCRRPLTFEEVWGPVNELWDLVEYDPEAGRNGWAGLTNPLLEWSNIIEDIRIERNGCRKYPGSVDKMSHLQDLILKQEEQGRVLAEHKGLPSNSDLAAVMGTFRDLGLGYTSPRQLGALAKYKVDSPQGVKFVTEGPLSTILSETIALDAAADMACIWLSMRVLGVLSKNAQGPQPPPPEGPEGPGPEGPGPEGPGGGQGKGKGKGKGKQAKVWAVGDRAVISTVEHGSEREGREVEITWAGVPNNVGEQNLKYILVEEK